MKPPQQKRPGNRGPRGSGPRRPGGPGDGQERSRQGGAGGPRHVQGDAPKGAPRGGSRPDEPRPSRAAEQAGPRRFVARSPQRTERLPEDRPARPDRPRPVQPAERRADSPAEPRSGPDSPRGTVWLYGLHAVGAALANPARRLRRLLLTADAEAALAASCRQPWPLAPEHVERGRLDHLLGRETVHQGAALLSEIRACNGKGSGLHVYGARPP